MVDQIARGDQIFARPFGGDTEPRLTHEGGREGKLQRFGIKAREHDLAAPGEPADQCVDERAIPRGIIEAGQDTAAPDFGRGTGPGTEG